MRVATAADFEDVRQANLDGMRLARAGELNVENRSGKLDIVGNRTGVARVEGSAFENVFGLASDGFALVVVEENLEFAKCDGGDAVETVGIEGARAECAQGFEGIGRAMREVIEAAAQMEAELLDVEFALALGAGVDADFIEGRRIDHNVVALGAVVEDFGGLLPDFWRANENVAMANEEPEFAAKRVDFDASGLGAAMVGGEPLVEGEGEVEDGGFVGGRRGLRVEGGGKGRRVSGIFEDGEAGEAELVVDVDDEVAVGKPELEGDVFATRIGFEERLASGPARRLFERLEALRSGEVVHGNERFVERIREIFRAHEEARERVEIVGIGRFRWRKREAAGIEFGSELFEEASEQRTSNAFENAGFVKAFKFERGHGSLNR